MQSPSGAKACASGASSMGAVLTKAIEDAPLTAAASNPEPSKLRVGVFADSRLQPRWLVEALARVARSGFAEILVIAAGEGGSGDEPLLWKLYGRLDRWAFARGGEDLGERVDLPSAVPHKHFFVFQGRNPVEGSLNLDVAFALGAFDDSLLDGLARYGVWRFRFGEGGGAAEPEALAGFRDVARNAALSGSGLSVRLGAGEPLRLAYQSWSRTYPLSVARNRAQLLSKTSAFAERALRELHRSGYGWLEQCRPVSGDRATSGFPGSLELASELGAIAGRIAHRGLEKALHVEQWFLAYRFEDAHPGDARAIPADLKGFTSLLPPKDRYWADPFVLEKNGRYFVFFEELPFKAGKAHISMVELDAATGAASASAVVLERPYHLSYPFLLEHEGQLYMVPETARNGTVEIYRCVDFPLSWKLERVLLEGVRCVDATFHRAADRWWIFANLAAPGSRVFDDELHLFHAEKLLGEWQPHPRNPIKSDARSARPAGQLYWRNGALFRPAQICAPLYGSGLSINRILRLTPTEYAERQVERILPSARDGLLGLHTVNRAGALTVVDAFARRPRFG